MHVVTIMKTQALIRSKSSLIHPYHQVYHRHHQYRHFPRRSFLPSLLLGCCYYQSFFFSSLTSSTTVAALNLVILTGSTRKEGPPRPILGPRVAEYITQGLIRRGNTVLDVINPNDFQLLQKPHFCYSKSQVPVDLDSVHKTLQKADGYICITPEYNHAPSPGLLNILNHFGSSTFSFKPSAIVSYSAGQWGGTRAAIGLRPILSELGCLPVSSMIHIPNAQFVLDENGNVIEKDDNQEQDEEKQTWDTYCDRTFSQLEWWSTAAKEHRTKIDPFTESPSFQKAPTQRNSPSSS